MKTERSGLRRMRFWVGVALLLGIGVPASAATWLEVEASGIVLRFQEVDRGIAGPLLGELVVGRSEVGRKLGGGFNVPMTVYLASSEGIFQELTGGRIPHWGVGCAFPAERMIVLRRLPGQQAELVRTARHEISHILLHDLVPTGVPVWFNEGTAMWAAQEWRLQQSAEVFYAVILGGLVPLADIDEVLDFSSSRANLAYTESLLAVLFLIHKGGQDAVAHMVESLAGGAAFDVALFRVTGDPPERFEQAWMAYVRGRFSLAAMVTSVEAFWLYMTTLVVVVFCLVRRRNMQTVARWEHEDPAQALPLRLRLQVHRREDGP